MLSLIAVVLLGAGVYLGYSVRSEFVDLFHKWGAGWLYPPPAKLVTPPGSSIVLAHPPQVRVVKRGRGNTVAAEFSFLMGGGFLENAVAWRAIGLEGRHGGGKTLLSVAIAKWLYEKGMVRGVFANFPIKNWYIPNIPSVVNTCIILDEGAQFADARESSKTWKGYGAFLRKLGSWMLSPSVFAVDRRMRPVTCERAWDLFLFGWWLYHWKDPRNMKGWFILSGYESLFNAYDHTFIPSDDGGILQAFKDEVGMLAGSQRKVFTVGRPLELTSPYDNPMDEGGGG